jgi:glucose-6-phosphate 1-epimerase
MGALPEPVHVLASEATGAISAHGAQVLSWVPDGGAEVLFVSRAARLDTGSAIRGGIPVVFPWFGPGRVAGMSPAHGFARTAAWRLLRVDDGADTATVEFGLTEQDATSEWFPHPFEARLTVTFGRELRVGLAVTNTGRAPFSYEDALHTYFRVGNAERVRIEGLDGATFVDKTHEGERAIQQGGVVITGETDRIYASTATARIVDPVLGRTICVAKAGSADTVVWNPWVDRARALGDLADDEWGEFVCVEAANIGRSAIDLVPGASHVTAVNVRIDD